jgi:glyoxylate reductase
MAPLSRVFATRALAGPAVERLARVCELDVWSERSAPPPEALADRVAAADGLLCLLTDR